MSLLIRTTLLLGILALPLRADTAAADWLPTDCVAVVEVYEPEAALTRFRGWVDDQAAAESELYRQVTANAELAQARLLLLGLAASAGADAWEAIGALLGDDIALGIAPGAGAGPQVGLVVRWHNEALADRLLDSMLTLGQLRNGDGPDPQRSFTIDNLTVYQVRDDSFLCRADNALLITNTRTAMRGVLETRAGKRKPITSTPRYRAAVQRIPAEAVAGIFADLAALRPLIDGDREQPERIAEPLPAFLFGGWYHALRHSEHGIAWARLTDDALVIDAHLPGEAPHPETHRGFSQARTVQPQWDAQQLPRYLAELRLARGWADLFRERETLLSLAGVSQANNFATTLSNLFGGLDFINEVLPHVGGPTRLIVADQVWPSETPVPVPHLPAFALVAPLKPEAPKMLQQRLFSAGQTALSLLNFDAAQKGEAAYLLDIDRHADTRLVFTRFADYREAGMQMDAVAEAADDDAPAEVGIRYNFAPAMTVANGQVVIATSETLARDIIDAVTSAEAGPRVETGSDALQLDGAALVRILRTNERELVINRMLEESQSRDDATRDIGIFLDLLEQFAELDLRVRPEAGGYLAEAVLRVRPLVAK